MARRKMAFVKQGLHNESRVPMFSQFLHARFLITNRLDRMQACYRPDDDMIERPDALNDPASFRSRSGGCGYILSGSKAKESRSDCLRFHFADEKERVSSKMRFMGSDCIFDCLWQAFQPAGSDCAPYCNSNCHERCYCFGSVFNEANKRSSSISARSLRDFAARTSDSPAFA